MFCFLVKRVHVLFFLLLFWTLALGRLSYGRAQEGPDVAQGVQLFAERHTAEAQRFFDAFVRAQPENPVALFYLGRIAFEEQRYAQAIEQLEKAVHFDENNSDYHLWLGRAYGHEAQRSAALRQPFLARKVKEHFEKAVELNPDNLDARVDLQEYYEKAPVIFGGGVEKAQQQAQEIARRKQQQTQR